MDTKYNHLIVEKDKNEKWIKNKYFINHDYNKKPFSIILPPPNVTGKLHLGHAWDSYLQDTIIRYKKLQGFDVCFVPGMDHAGIATQAKVEQKLLDENIDKYELGREKFVIQAMNWKNDYAKHIKDQWYKLGLALDYSSERFTLDEKSNKAVNHVFIKMYNDGLIYRGIKAINWDPKLKTALSNIEVISKPTNSKMYYVKYWYEDKSDFLVIATTRIETIFSDVAIGINPSDERFSKLKNIKLINPLTNKLLPIIADEYIDPNFGTGLMKISAHATSDIEIILKHNLEIIECINDDGLMNEHALFVNGMTRNDAREAIYDYLTNNGLLEKVESIVNNVAYSERSDEVIEILVKPQWFVKMDKLSKMVLDNLNTKEKVKIYPKRFESTLKTWLENIHDWTISRQLWWGHQIPVWYKDEQVKVQVESPGNDWERETDVLDTWFSSALCPFSFLDWIDDEEKFKRYFPTSLLVTGYDIIFFWVARMYFQSLYFTKKIPFNDLLIHGLIRDEHGRKMSKSLNNGIDPMDVIDQYGSDSLRWYLLTNSTPGQDINFSKEKIEFAWSLNNKLWNIARFIKNMKEVSNSENSIADNWIYFKLYQLSQIIDEKMSKYEFTLIGKEICSFIYDDFSSWYIEFSKVWPNKRVALDILKRFLILIHPFLPFLTDHLFKELFNSELLENLIDIEKYEDVIEINKIIEVITLIREARNELNISNKQIIKYSIKDFSNESIVIVDVINKLANSDYFNNDGIVFSMNNTHINIYLDEELKKNELEKTNKKISLLKNEIARSESILNNEKFVKNAPKNKVDEEKQKYENYLEQYNVLIEKLKELK